MYTNTHTHVAKQVENHTHTHTDTHTDVHTQRQALFPTNETATNSSAPSMLTLGPQAILGFWHSATEFLKLSVWFADERKWVICGTPFMWLCDAHLAQHKGHSVCWTAGKKKIPVQPCYSTVVSLITKIVPIHTVTGTLEPKLENRTGVVPARHRGHSVGQEPSLRSPLRSSWHH